MGNHKLTALIAVFWLSRVDGAELSFPKMSAEALETPISGLLNLGTYLYTITPQRALVVKTPFKSSGKNRKQVFGDLIDSKRFPIQEAPADGHWNGIVDADGSLLLFDGAHLGMLEIDKETFAKKTFRTIAWENTIKPPRDRLGESTHHEINQVRARFKKAYLATESVLFSALTAIPEAWRTGIDDHVSSKDRYYFVLSNIGAFPLLTLRCDGREASQCQVSRSCPIAIGARGTIDGLAVDREKRELLVLHSKYKEISRYHFDSCLAVKPLGKFMLPKNFKTATALSVTDDGRLWVGTMRPDDYENAAIYTWAREEWWKSK